MSEAVEPMRVSMEMDVEREEWKGAAVRASNLSELQLTRGEISDAEAAGEQSVTYADRSGSTFQQMGNLTTRADALHQAGRRDASRRLFEDAESRQAERQPENPRLYSLPGFRYCDLLLSDAERAVWRCCLLVPLTASTAACDAAIERAGYSLKIAERNHWLLDIALNHLTLARAALYKAAHSGSPIPQAAFDHVYDAVNGLRASGQMDDLPRGLLTRAWLRFLSGDEAGCRADLDEAWEIAERGPMPLFQADIQLYRARLFHDRAALAEARRLIEKHGYHRRYEELADAEEAPKGW